MNKFFIQRTKVITSEKKNQKKMGEEPMIVVGGVVCSFPCCSKVRLVCEENFSDH